MNIVGKFVDVAGFAAHVASLQFGAWRPSFTVVHNTSSPTLANYAEWRAHPEKHGNWTPEQWGRNLASYYSGLGWLAGPHAFVCPDGILLFTPFTQHGTHTPSWNSISWGIETVGEFESELYGNGTRTNLVATLGILHHRLGLNPADYKLGVRGLHFHKEDVRTTHRTCPGRNMVKADLISDVVAYMSGLAPGDHIDIPAAVHVADTLALTNDELTSVTWLQTSLNQDGFGPLVADGIAGVATRAAVIVFQKTMGLPADGVAGPVTRLRIKQELARK